MTNLVPIDLNSAWPDLNVLVIELFEEENTTEIDSPHNLKKQLIVYDSLIKEKQHAFNEASETSSTRRAPPKYEAHADKEGDFWDFIKTKSWSPWMRIFKEYLSIKAWSTRIIMTCYSRSSSSSNCWTQCHNIPTFLHGYITIFHNVQSHQSGNCILWAIMTDGEKVW